MAGRRRQEIPDAGATMQIDALVDELEDLGEGDELGAAPPPLPPKKVSRVVWVGGALVVLTAVALGIGAGVILLGGEPAPVAAPSPVPPVAPAPAAPSVASAPSSEASTPEPSPPEEPTRDTPGVVQMDEFVFGD